MEILIHTHGRHDRQTTYNALPIELQEQAITVIQHSEQSKWTRGEDHTTLHILPPEITEIGPTREYVINTFGPKICMLDDDLVFATRRRDDPTKFLPSTGKEIQSMFMHIENALDSYAHVGVSHREGANRNTQDHLFNSRYMRITAYRTDIVRKVCEHRRVKFMADFDVNLQLLKKGYKSIILNRWVHNQSGSDTSGGCSVLRTPEALAESAHKMAELHAPFVKVVKKVTKSSWGGGERTDVTIQWKKAFNSAEEEKDVKPYKS